jgi:hypothetical protein
MKTTNGRPMNYIAHINNSDYVVADRSPEAAQEQMAKLLRSISGYLLDSWRARGRGLTAVNID